MATVSRTETRRPSEARPSSHADIRREGVRSELSLGRPRRAAPRAAYGDWRDPNRANSQPIPQRGGLTSRGPWAGQGGSKHERPKDPLYRGKWPLSWPKHSRGNPLPEHPRGTLPASASLRNASGPARRQERRSRRRNAPRRGKWAHRTPNQGDNPWQPFRRSFRVFGSIARPKKRRSSTYQ
jgi:hypothetical protein